MPQRLLILTALLISCLLPCPARAADEVLVVVSAPVEGDMRDFGLPTLQAAELAVEDYNAAGGVLGRPVRLLPFNDECRPEKVEELLKLVDGANATLMIGPVCNGMAREALPRLNQRGVVVISPSVTDPDLTKPRTYPLFFRTMTPSDAQPETQAAFLRKKGFTRIALLHDASRDGLEQGAVVRRLVQGDPALTLAYDVDLKGGEEAVPAVKSILRDRADAVVYQGERGLGCAMLALLREAGFKGAFLCNDQFWDDALLAKLNAFAEDLYFTGPLDPAENPLYQVALERFRAASEDADPPGPYFYHAYAATLALLNAVERAETTEPRKVADMLRLHKAETPLGRIGFDEAGDVTGAGMVVYQYRDGEIREVFRQP
ncbi:branched-chain amino acid ABC transporter substrate-binding protein [Salidesulfovibrio onnuriiensis]|uniref:branched-chain amino acid ABC transporter substrate-binding protein n=1 Tax=Salidesulfovibrio onnuriiensis TaxID=2583823 RepID=UPI0011C99391|nr:branched-chain amino acid ABC transporter substrate-binding protein [Salidesulfovibrio onnuriiensis]